MGFGLHRLHLFGEGFQSRIEDFDIDFCTRNCGARFRKPNFGLKKFFFQLREFVGCIARARRAIGWDFRRSIVHDVAGHAGD